MQKHMLILLIFDIEQRCLKVVVRIMFADNQLFLCKWMLQPPAAVFIILQCYRLSTLNIHGQKLSHIFLEANTSCCRASLGFGSVLGCLRNKKPQTRSVSIAVTKSQPPSRSCLGTNTNPHPYLQLYVGRVNNLGNYHCISVPPFQHSAPYA